MAGWMAFPGLRRLWPARREVAKSSPLESVGWRYHVSSLCPNRLTIREILSHPCLHWIVENCCFRRLGMQFDEDRRRFATVGGAQPAWACCGCRP